MPWYYLRPIVFETYFTYHRNGISNQYFFRKVCNTYTFLVHLTFIFCVKVLHMYNTLCYYSNVSRDFEYFKTKYVYPGIFLYRNMGSYTENYWILFNRVSNYKKLCFMFFFYNVTPDTQNIIRYFFIRRSRIRNNV